MKLLLTSAGITNKTIQNALEELLGNEYGELHAMYVPTAKNAESRDKGWAIRNLTQLYSLNWKEFDMLDIASVDSDYFWERIQDMDVLIWGRGDPAFLANKVKEKLSVEQIKELFDTKIHVGISAGGMFISPKAYFYGETEKQRSTTGLGVIDFYTKPHYSPDEPQDFDQYIEDGMKVYCIDDESAVKVDGDDIQVVSEGNTKRL